MRGNDRPPRDRRALLRDRTDWTRAGAWTDGLLTVECGEAVIKTSGASTNPLKAFVQALMRALNRIQ